MRLASIRLAIEGTRDRRHHERAGKNTDESAVEIAILRAGVLAQEFCRRGEDARVPAARVAAVFERSFYLESGTTFVCVGAPSVGNGPLTLIADLEASARLSALGLLPGQPATISRRSIIIGDAVRLSLGGCDLWRPSPWRAGRPPAGSVETSLARRAAVEAPLEGLARTAFGASPFLGLAVPRIAGFESWLSGSLSCDDGPVGGAPEAVSPLIGLGPGLTPSGDDFLSGALAVLDALGERNVHAAMARAIADAAQALTSPLSACLLLAAAAGHVSERLHDVVSAFLAGDAEAAVTAARAIGHSSGWDMLAGVAAAYRIVATRRV